MRKTLSVLAIIAAFGSSSALATITGTFTGGEVKDWAYIGTGVGNVTIADGSDVITNAFKVYGCKADTGEASGATVTMTGGSIPEDVYGGYVNSEGNASNNTVVISGGSVDGYVCGGFNGHEGNADNNTVTIAGGSFSSNIYGGWLNGDEGSVCNNTVNLVGEGATFGQLTGSALNLKSIQVGYTMGNICTGNTLNIYGKGISTQGLFEFQNINFYLTPNIVNGDTMVTVNISGSNIDLRNVKVGVKCSGTMQLTTGDTVKLIDATGTNGIRTNDGTTYNVDVLKGVTATYTGSVAVTEDNKNLVLTIGEGTPIPGPTPVPGPKVETNTLKSMTETRTDVAALVNATADFMSAAGMQQAKLAAKSATAAGQNGAAPFVVLGGSHLRYNTGSHVNANGFNAALGVAKAVSAVTLGVAGEYGTSDYKSYVGGVRGNGDSKLFGGAVLADWQGKQGWHAEGSVRLGRARYDYNAMTPLGHTDYSDKASYQSVGIGGGKEFKVSSKSEDTVDVYARYMYGHTNGSNAKASSGESMHFAGVNSHRTMVGARYNHELTDSATLYAGAAWMHEFDGDAHSVIGGFTSPAPTLKGNSGMVELGTTFAPLDSQNVLINLNVQGWTGVQRGISGGAGCTIKF